MVNEYVLRIVYCPFFIRRIHKIVKSNLSFIMSVCLSVHPSVHMHGTTRLPMDGFSGNLIFEDFSKYVAKIQVSLKSDNNKAYFTCFFLFINTVISNQITFNISFPVS